MQWSASSHEWHRLWLAGKHKKTRLWLSRNKKWPMLCMKVKCFESKIVQHGYGLEFKPTTIDNQVVIFGFGRS